MRCELIKKKNYAFALSQWKNVEGGGEERKNKIHQHIDAIDFSDRKISW